MIKPNTVIPIRPLIVKNEFLIRDFPLINEGRRAITIIHYFKFKLEVSFSLSVNIATGACCCCRGWLAHGSEPIGSLRVWA